MAAPRASTDVSSGRLLARSIARPYGEELTVAAQLAEGVSVAEVKRELDGFLARRHAEVLVAEVFGPPGLCAAFAEAARWPVMAVGEPGQAAALSGVIVTAVAGTQVQRVLLDGQVVGSVWSDSGARLCRLGDLRPLDVRGSDALQARATFLRLEQALERAGFTFSQVVRTWFYNRDILGWYRDFNLVRDGFFRTHGTFDGLVPASTGIGSPNPHGSAILAGALAVRPEGEAGRAAALASPLQCPAPKYGRSFSRAVELSFPGLRRILVSGTASIEPGGASAHVGDMSAQIDLTLQVVAAILESRGAGWRDVTRGVAYLRRAEDLTVWQRYQERHLAGLPIVTTRDVVCREELLFELELDAAVAV